MRFILLAAAAAVWMFVLVIAPVLALVMLIVGLAVDDRRRRKATHALAVVSVASLFAAGVHAAPQASQSAGPAKDLATLMSLHNQTALAAKDPETGELVAALLYPGVQLLVVSGKPQATDAVDAQLAARNFQDVYAALQDGAAQKGRLFIQDLGADGLNDGGESIDVAYEEGRQTLFDGNPRAHKINEKSYREIFSKTDARYAHMIGLLLERSKQF